MGYCAKNTQDFSSCLSRVGVLFAAGQHIAIFEADFRICILVAEVIFIFVPCLPTLILIIKVYMVCLTSDERKN